MWDNDKRIIFHLVKILVEDRCLGLEEVQKPSMGIIIMLEIVFPSLRR